MIQLKTGTAHLKLNVNVAACFDVWFNCSRFDCWFNRLSCCFHSLWSEMIFALSFFRVLKSEIKIVKNGFRFDMCLKRVDKGFGRVSKWTTHPTTGLLTLCAFSFKILSIASSVKNWSSSFVSFLRTYKVQSFNLKRDMSYKLKLDFSYVFSKYAIVQIWGFE